MISVSHSVINNVKIFPLKRGIVQEPQHPASLLISFFLVGGRGDRRHQITMSRPFGYRRRGHNNYTLVTTVLRPRTSPPPWRDQCFQSQNGSCFDIDSITTTKWDRRNHGAEIIDKHWKVEAAAYGCRFSFPHWSEDLCKCDSVGSGSV